MDFLTHHSKQDFTGQASKTTGLVALGTPCDQPSAGSAVWPQGIILQQLLFLSPFKSLNQDL